MGIEKMTSPTTPTKFLASLPDDRRLALKAIRKVIRDNLDPLFAEEVLSVGFSYHLPHKVYPAGYHCDPSQPLPFAGIAAQKHHIGLYLFCVYADPTLEEWFRAAWPKAGKKLDMGKSCVRVKDLDGVPLDVLSRFFKRMTAKKFKAAYEATLVK